MFKISGKNAEAKIFTDSVEEQALNQIYGMLNHPVTSNTQVAIMPDVHAGKGSTIGTTIRLSSHQEEWKVSPNVVGVDIGCGMMSYKIKEKNIDLKKLDETITRVIPAGFSVHKKSLNQELVEEILSQLSYEIDQKGQLRIEKSLGSLGGGNHFIELAKDENKDLWLTVHSGSRNLGVRTADTHQKLAEKTSLSDNRILAYLEGDLLKDYIADMTLTQQFAHLNRKYMLNRITEAMDFTVIDEFDSIHNFIDVEQGIIRKGATSAQNGERLIIPLNMRDGSLICRGKGNEEWNFSAPHGAGRTMSRLAARQKIDFSIYEAQMKNVYSSSIRKSTIDEAPDAYKPYQSIVENIGDTVEILHHIKPIYNFKAH